MDFHAFKRSKALQSPVCLVGWNSEGTAEQPEAAELWLSLSWAWIDWRGVWALIKAGMCPGESRARLHLLCSRGWTASSPALLLLRGAAAQPSETGQRLEMLLRLQERQGSSSSLWTPVPAPLGAFGKHWEWQGRLSDLALTITHLSVLWAALCITLKHPQPSPTTARAQQK